MAKCSTASGSSRTAVVIEVQFDTSDLLYIYLDRRKRRRKFTRTTFLQALVTAPTRK